MKETGNETKIYKDWSECKMTLNDIVEVMSGGTDVEVFADCKRVHFGLLADMPVAEYKKYKNRYVYRVNINKNAKCITIAV